MALLQHSRLEPSFESRVRRIIKDRAVFKIREREAVELAKQFAEVAGEQAALDALRISKSYMGFASRTHHARRKAAREKEPLAEPINKIERKSFEDRAGKIVEKFGNGLRREAALTIARRIASTTDEKRAMAELRKARSLAALAVVGNKLNHSVPERQLVTIEAITKPTEPLVEEPAIAQNNQKRVLDDGPDSITATILYGRRLTAVNRFVNELPQYNKTEDDAIRMKSILLSALAAYEGNRGMQEKIIQIAIEAESLADFNIRMRNLIVGMGTELKIPVSRADAIEQDNQGEKEVIGLVRPGLGDAEFGRRLNEFLAAIKTGAK